ncbi:MAG: hypothetical protein KAR56_04260 [Thermoplasmata archaeon]|nr:hypothetical protein [Thermoplasmata archaeon]
MERRTRGSVLNGYLKFIEHKWGVSNLKIARADMGIDNLNFKDGQYYQDEIIGNVLRWINRNKGQEAVKEAGRFILHNLGILNWMVRFNDFQTLALKFPKNFSEVYAFGSCEIDASNPNKIRMILKDVCYYEEACLVWEGICQEALTITKTQGKVSHTSCERQGETQSVFIVEIIQ